MFSDCHWTTEVYRNAFWYKGEIAEIGIPRNDIYFENSDEVNKVVREKFGIDKETFVILYAPTFRNEKNKEVFIWNYERVIKECSNRLGKDAVMILRLHPNDASLLDTFALENTIINGSSYPDIQELVLMSDMLITDFSSVMFDFLLHFLVQTFYVLKNAQLHLAHILLLLFLAL